MNEIKCYPCGTMVTCIIGGAVGTISCVSNRFDKINYEVTYFFGGEFKTVWLHESEFKVEENAIKIGFNK